MTKPVLIRGATLVDAGGERSGDLLVEGNTIRRVGDIAGGDYEEYSANGRYVTPGLIDCHVHLVADGGPDVTTATRRSEAELALLVLSNAQKALEAGVTTMRDCGGYKFVEVAVRDAINRGIVPGPNLLTSGHFITTTGGHGYFMGHEADGATELVKAARTQLRGGVDWLKIMTSGGVLGPGAHTKTTQMTAEEVAAVVEEGRRAGKKTAAHAHSTPGIQAAVEGGVSSVEHGTYLTDELAETMSRKGVFLVPTAIAIRAIVEGGTKGGIPRAGVEKAKAAIHANREAVGRAANKGVLLAMGTDAGTPFNDHGQNVRELEVLVAFGLSPQQALAAATINAARLLEVDTRVGLLKEGMAADLVVLDQNPMDDITAFRKRMKRVMHGGTLIDM